MLYMPLKAPRVGFWKKEVIASGTGIVTLKLNIN